MKALYLTTERLRFFLLRQEASRRQFNAHVILEDDPFYVDSALERAKRVRYLAAHKQAIVCAIHLQRNRLAKLGALP